MFKIDKKVVKLKSDIDDIMLAGKEMTLERKGTLKYLMDKPGAKFTIAEFNFFKKHLDLFIDDEKENTVIYYGHVEGLGFFVTEGEIDG